MKLFSDHRHADMTIILAILSVLAFIIVLILVFGVRPIEFRGDPIRLPDPISNVPVVEFQNGSAVFDVREFG